MVAPHRDGAEALAAVVGAAVDSLHGAGGSQDIRDEVPVAAKLVHDRAQQPLLLRGPRNRLPAASRATRAPPDLRDSTCLIGCDMDCLIRPGTPCPIRRDMDHLIRRDTPGLIRHGKECLNKRNTPCLIEHGMNGLIRPSTTRQSRHSKSSRIRCAVVSYCDNWVVARSTMKCWGCQTQESRVWVARIHTPNHKYFGDVRSSLATPAMGCKLGLQQTFLGRSRCFAHFQLGCGTGAETSTH